MRNGGQGLSRRDPDRRVVIQWAVCLLLVIAFLSVGGTFPSPMNAQVLDSTNNSLIPGVLLPPPTPSSPADFTPTSTPAELPIREPTQMARKVSWSEGSVPGQPQVDANTVALYHLDTANGSQVIDDTGRHMGTLQGNASITSQGVYAGALQVSSGGRVLTGYLGDLRQGTIEAFVDLKEPCRGTIGPAYPFVVAGPDPANGQINLLFGSYDRTNSHYPTVSLSILVDGVWQSAAAGINSCRYLTGYNPWAPYWPYDVWRFHHVAGTWGPRGMEIWVDGILHGVNSDPGGRQSCNPQEQIWGEPYNSTLDYGQVKSPPWWGYPNCPFPHLTNSPPPGTYTGGLPAYNAFQIGGCAPGMDCLNSRLDEVRISNVQRTFKEAVVPTVTLTPTPTPVHIGAYGVDQYTMALYHMDSASGEFVYDEVSHRAATANHNLTLSTGRYGSAVVLDGATGIRIPGPDQPAGGTIEAWVNLTADSDPLVIFGGFHYYGGLYTLLGKSSQLSQNLVFAIGDGGTRWNIADSGIRPSSLIGSWHHIAGTYGAAGLQIWVDGQVRGTASYFGKTTPAYSYSIGSDASFRGIKGQIDEFRYSSVQRAFAPLATPTPVFSVLPASIATTTFQASSPGLTDDARINGMINPVYRSLSQPSGSFPTGPLAAASAGLSPVPVPAAAIAIPPLPVPGNTPPSIAASPALKTNSLSVDQPLALDANAIALYRLNSQYGITLSDATGNNPALLFGDATIKSQGAERPALTLNGGLSYAQATHFKSPRSGTVEVWANFQANPGQVTILAARQNNAPRFLLGVRADENLSLGFGLYQAGWRWADSGVTLQALGSGWHHVAGTWGPRGVEIWIDGSLRGVNPYANGMADEGDSTLLIGWSPGSAGMNGQLSQIRISNTQRSY